MALESDLIQENDNMNHFESTNIPLWEQDFSPIVQYLKDFHEAEDIEQVFADFPEEIFVCSNRIITRRINSAMLHLYHANSLDEFFAGMAWNFVEETIEAVGIMIPQIIKTRSGFQIESYIGAVDRQKRRALLHWIVPNDAKERLDRVLLTIKLI